MRKLALILLIPIFIIHMIIIFTFTILHIITTAICCQLILIANKQKMYKQFMNDCFLCNNNVRIYLNNEFNNIKNKYE